MFGEAEADEALMVCVFCRFKDESHVAAEGVAPEAGGRRGKSAHEHTTNAPQTHHKLIVNKLQTHHECITSTS